MLGLGTLRSRPTSAVHSWGDLSCSPFQSLSVYRKTGASAQGVGSWEGGPEALLVARRWDSLIVVMW